MNPLRPLQTALNDAVHQSKLILRIIEWGLLGLVLSQIVTQNLGARVSVRRSSAWALSSFTRLTQRGPVSFSGDKIGGLLSFSGGAIPLKGR